MEPTGATPPPQPPPRTRDAKGKKRETSSVEMRTSEAAKGLSKQEKVVYKDLLPILSPEEKVPSLASQSIAVFLATLPRFKGDRKLPPHLAGSVLQNYNALKYLVQKQLLGHLADAMAPSHYHGRLVLTNVKVDDATLQKLAAKLPELKGLYLERCPLTDASISVVAERCPHLQFVELRTLSSITDKSISSLANHCNKLEFLRLTNCREITDASISSLAKGCPGLKGLCLEGGPKITDTSIDALVKQKTPLQMLELFGCSKISIKTITELLNSLPLRLLALPLGVVSEEALSNLRAQFPTVRIDLPGPS